MAITTAKIPDNVVLIDSAIAKDLNLYLFVNSPLGTIEMLLNMNDIERTEKIVESLWNIIKQTYEW